MRSFASHIGGAAALALAAGLAAEAHATIQTVHFTVGSNNWFGGTAPYGLPPQPTISGSVTVNSALAGNAGFVGLQYTTGSRVWTLADIISGALSNVDGATYNFAGIVSGFVLEMGSPADETFVATNNTAGIDYPARPTAPGPRGTGIGCNGCVHITSVAIAAPEPAAWAVMLLGVGAVGVGLRGRRREERRA
jgi:hypothetical protein